MPPAPRLKQAAKNALLTVPSYRSRRDDVFFSVVGDRYADNPRAIAEELRRRGDGRRQVWAVTDPKTPLPPGVVGVLRGTRECVEAMQRARYVVANAQMAPYYRKRRGSVYLQTWHGTPYKRIGRDLPRELTAERRETLRTFRRDALQWDLLVSQNAYSTPIFRRAFGYDGPVVETGYPRNDDLVGPEAETRRARARSALGVGDSRVVLYAPTFRDHQFDDAGRPTFRLELGIEELVTRLGDGWVLLLRLHPFVSGLLDRRVGDQVIDVSEHADIADLYLAADVMVTDYSSAMFDFTVTRKPVVFYAYDYDDYRSTTRGVYFDLEEVAPGPVVRTADALADSLLDLGRVEARHAAAYERFAERFLSLDDGRAAGRVVDAVFGG